MANKGRFFVSMSDAWAKNERMIQQRDYEEDHYEGHEKAPRKVLRAGDKTMEVWEDAALGLDGSEFHMGGDMVTNIKEERLDGGDVAVYWQKADGGTYRQVWRKVGDGRHTPAGRPKRYYSF